MIRSIRCHCCGRLNRLRENAPHNAAFCPPVDKISRSCSHRYAKLKSYQRKIWNEFLWKKYDRDKKKLESCWGMKNLLEQGKPWLSRGVHAVPHPMDFAKNYDMTSRAKDDYLKWRNSRALQNPKNNRILRDEVILGSKQQFEIGIKTNG